MIKRTFLQSTILLNSSLFLARKSCVEALSLNPSSSSIQSYIGRSYYRANYRSNNRWLSSNGVKRWNSLKASKDIENEMNVKVMSCEDEEASSSVQMNRATIPMPQGKPVGIIFDMDGTLLKPAINFTKMRNGIYAICDAYEHTKNVRGDVLELVDSKFNAEQKVAAKHVFDEIEREALEAMQLMEGVVDVLKMCDENGVKKAVLTRNVLKSVEYMQREILKNLEVQIADFDDIVARDTIVCRKIIPSKPEPDAILHICEQWNCHPVDVIMVGDCKADDVVAANRAGCASIWLNTGKDNDAGGEQEMSSRKCPQRWFSHIQNYTLSLYKFMI